MSKINPYASAQRQPGVAQVHYGPSLNPEDCAAEGDAPEEFTPRNRAQRRAAARAKRRKR